MNLAYPAGDPRPTPVITSEQVAYLLNEFETNIYPTEKDYFRAPDAHGGTNAILDDMILAFRLTITRETSSLSW